MLTTSKMSTMRAMRRFLPVTALMIAATTATALTAPAARQDEKAIKRGEEVYAAQKCQTCHSIAGKGGKQSVLDGVGAKLTADEIRQWIVTPTEMTKKTGSTKKPPMPNRYSKLPAADIDALVGYLASLK